MGLARESTVSEVQSEESGRNEVTKQDSAMADHTELETVEPAENGKAAMPLVAQNGTNAVKGNSELREESPGPPVNPQELKVNGFQDRPQSSSSTSSAPSRTGVRRTGSKFANLRAAFEGGPATGGKTESVKRRLTNREKTIDRANEQRQEYETETARLKSELDKEKELRIAFEEKVTSLEEAVEDLNSQLEERDEEHQSQIMELKEEAETRLRAMDSGSKESARGGQQLTEAALGVETQCIDFNAHKSASERHNVQARNRHSSA